MPFPEPVCDSQLKEEVQQTTNTSVRVTYTESNPGTFDNYTLRILYTISGSTQQQQQVNRARSEPDRAVIFSGLQPGTDYTILILTVSGTESTSVESDSKSIIITTGVYSRSIPSLYIHRVFQFCRNTFIT